MDEVLKHLDPHIGYKNSEGLRISYLAFADDLILVAASPRGLQDKVNRLSEGLKLTGLQLNEAKCATMRIQIDGKKKKLRIQTHSLRLATEEIRGWVEEKWLGCMLSFDAVVLYWRGALYAKSSRLLRRLGIREFDLKIMVVRVLTYTSSMFRHFNKSTTRSC